jgi:hypothetical protein
MNPRGRPGIFSRRFELIEYYSQQAIERELTAAPSERPVRDPEDRLA